MMHIYLQSMTTSVWKDGENLIEIESPSAKRQSGTYIRNQ
jgi:hypothetical protein